MAVVWDDVGGSIEIAEGFGNGNATGHGVRALIVNSWRRCQAAGLTPDGVHPQPLDDLDFDCGLVRAARPVFERLQPIVEATPASMFLGDERGVMFLRNVGETDLRRTLDAVGAAPGFRYSEADMGTNAFGSALLERRVCQVSGSEHFAEALHGITAVGTPVRNPLSGRVTGVVSVACPNDTANAEVMAVSRQAAAAIEQRLLDMAVERERDLLEEFLRTQRVGAGDVVPGSAPWELCRRDRLALEEAAVRLVAQGSAAMARVALSDGRAATLMAHPVPDSTAIAVEVWITDG